LSTVSTYTVAYRHTLYPFT